MTLTDHRPAPMPTLACRGLCHQSCGPVPMTAKEVVALQNAAGRVFDVQPSWVPDDSERTFQLVVDDSLACPALTKDRRCSGYAGRPMLCRLYGMVDHPRMRCPHGCEPTRWLSNEEAGKLLANGDP